MRGRRAAQTTRSRVVSNCATCAHVLEPGCALRSRSIGIKRRGDPDLRYDAVRSVRLDRWDFDLVFVWISSGFPLVVRQSCGESKTICNSRRFREDDILHALPAVKSASAHVAAIHSPSLAHDALESCSSLAGLDEFDFASSPKWL